MIAYFLSAPFSSPWDTHTRTHRPPPTPDLCPEQHLVQGKGSIKGFDGMRQWYPSGYTPKKKFDQILKFYYHINYFFFLLRENRWIVWTQGIESYIVGE